jgi:hypothetical protein
VLAALSKRLLLLQDVGGGWPLRDGETPSLTFTFYPVLALVRAARAGIRIDGSLEALRAAARFIEDGLRTERLGLEEQVLAHFALERILTAVPADLVRRREQLMEVCWRADTGMGVVVGFSRRRCLRS